MAIGTAHARGWWPWLFDHGSWPQPLAKAQGQASWPWRKEHVRGPWQALSNIRKDSQIDLEIAADGFSLLQIAYSLEKEAAHLSNFNDKRS